MDRLDKFAELFDTHFEREADGYRRFAAILTNIAKRKKPWQYTFVYNILRKADGFNVGDQMWSALLAFEKERSGALRQFTVMSVYDVGMFAMVLSPPKECAWEECPEQFIPNHPNGKYCSDRCQMDARNKRKREARLNTTP